MLFWPAGAALVIVWNVFRDPSIDHRVVIAGALLPDLLDTPFGGARVAHTLVASVALLMAVMLLTRGLRQARRRWLALPIGTFVHLVVDGAWSHTSTFWWPAFGWELSGPLAPLDRAPALLAIEELVGLAALVWFVRRFGLWQPAARSAFLRTGRLPRDRAGPGSGPS